MIRFVRTDSANPDFIGLVKLLDAELAMRDGADHSFYSQFNKIDLIKYAVVSLDDDTPIACGAIKEYDKETMEIKRMYVLPAYRGKGLAGLVLSELEKWASALGCRRCILETGKKQPEAIQVYKKSGYQIISNYGQYQGIENSVCFEKRLVLD